VIDKAPPTVNLLVCPVCGRNDRFMHLSSRHFAGGVLCPGTPEFAKYVKEDS
jgi:hypothetical protein